MAPYHPVLRLFGTALRAFILVPGPDHCWRMACQAFKFVDVSNARRPPERTPSAPRPGEMTPYFPVRRPFGAMLRMFKFVPDEFVELSALESVGHTPQTKRPPAGGLFVCLARPERFELPTFWFVARHSIQLSYGRKNWGGDYRSRA